MKLFDHIDKTKLETYIEDGYVIRVNHPFLSLSLYTYGRKAVHGDLWDEITEFTRGIIVDSRTGDIIARPFSKFFNINTRSRPETWLTNLPPDHLSKPLITEKLDGSMVTFFKYGNHWGMATKGSFNSDQAIWATRHMSEHIKRKGLLVLPTGYTPVFEVICQDVQHHVVHYEHDGLILLAMISNSTGEEMSYPQLVELALRNNLSYVDRAYDEALNLKTLRQILQEDRPNKEGYVVSYSVGRPGIPPLKIKIKHETFLKHQKIVHNASPKVILEMLKTGEKDVINEWIKVAPENLVIQIMNWVERYETAYKEVFELSSMQVAIALKNFTTRKESAEYFREHSCESVCFAMLDQKDHKRVIWRWIEQHVVIDFVPKEEV